MFSSTSEIVIDRPMAVVFDYISHMENDPIWCPEVVSVKQHDDSAPGVGKKYDLVARPIPKNQHGWYEITEFDPPSFMRLKLKQGNNTGETTCRLERAGEGTRLSYTTEVSLSGIASLFEGMVGRMTTKTRGPRMLNNLKKILEAEAEPTPS